MHFLPWTTLDYFLQLNDWHLRRKLIVALKKSMDLINRAWKQQMHKIQIFRKLSNFWHIFRSCERNEYCLKINIVPKQVLERKNHAPFILTNFFVHLRYHSKIRESLCESLFSFRLVRAELFSMVENPTFENKNSAYLVLVVLAHHFGLSPLPNRHIWLPGSHWHYCPVLSPIHWWILTEMLNSTAFCGAENCYWILPNPLMPWQHNASEKVSLCSLSWLLLKEAETLDHGAARNTTEFTSAVTQFSSLASAGEFWALTELLFTVPLRLSAITALPAFLN